MAKIIDWFPKIIFCAIPEIIMLMIPRLRFYFYFLNPKSLTFFYFGFLVYLYPFPEELIEEIPSLWTPQTSDRRIVFPLRERAGGITMFTFH
jgi:hypothetical protein